MAYENLKKLFPFGGNLKNVLPTAEEDISRVRARNALKGELTLVVGCTKFDKLMFRVYSLAGCPRRLWSSVDKTVNCSSIARMIHRYYRTHRNYISRTKEQEVDLALFCKTIRASLSNDVAQPLNAYIQLSEPRLPARILVSPASSL